MNALYSQNIKTEAKIKEFKIETNNLDKLKNFNWEKVEKFFSQNDKNDSIKIVLIYNTESKSNSKTDIKLNSLNSEIKGKTLQLNNMIQEAKEMINEFVETEKELKTSDNPS